jgi:uncharacterized protein (TIGR02246 family)
MKNRLLLWIALGSAGWCFGHAAEPAAANATVNTASIKAEVIATYNAAITAAESLNVDALAAFLTDNDEGSLVINGRIQLTRSDAVEATRKNFRTLKAVKYDVGTRHVTVLGPDVALLVTNGSVTVQGEEGPSFNREFAHTVVYVRQNGIWRVLHSHQSNPR